MCVAFSGPCPISASVRLHPRKKKRLPSYIHARYCRYSHQILQLCASQLRLLMPHPSRFCSDRLVENNLFTTVFLAPCQWASGGYARIGDHPNHVISTIYIIYSRPIVALSCLASPIIGDPLYPPEALTHQFPKHGCGPLAIAPQAHALRVIGDSRAESSLRLQDVKRVWVAVRPLFGAVQKGSTVHHSLRRYTVDYFGDSPLMMPGAETRFV